MLYIKILLLCASALASVTSRPKYSEEPHALKLHFEEFIVTHGKQYADEAEKNARFEIFKENVAIINKKNSNPKETARFAVNKFADLTSEEFIQKYTGLHRIPDAPHIKNENVSYHFNAPDSFDWRDKKAVTGVKNQGQCGSCWAFSTTGAVEGAYAIKHGSLLEVSEQQLVDCDTTSNGCGGGLMRNALNYIMKAGGIEGENDYPYTAEEGKCKFDSSKVRIKVTKSLPFNLKNAEVTKQYLVQHGPMAIAVAAADFQHYDGHILMECPSQGINHGVLLVGYGTENGVNYWIIKNSWGTDFGDKGYIKVAYKPGSNPCAMYNSGYAVGVEVE